MSVAGTDGLPLLLLQGPVEATDEAVFVLRTCLDADPMFGCAAARIRCAAGCCFRGRSRSGLEAGPWIPRRTLAEVVDIEVSPELVDPSLLMSPEIATEFGPLDSRFSSLSAALLLCLNRARRCGYRVVVANRAVVGLSGLRCSENVRRPAPVPEADRTLLQRLAPDLNRSWDESRAASSERFETLHGQAVRAAEGIRPPSLLLDIRNVVPVHNGTTQATLGCVHALRQLSSRWEVAVLANPAAVTFHALADLCRDWPLYTAVPPRTFTAALRLSQPWHIQEMIELHRSALFNAYFILDTIAWDVVYAAPPHLDGTWTFLADHADGFLFDSAFTEGRFLARFERARETLRTVCHYPFDPAEYVRHDAQRTTSSEHILIVGNELDHKDVLRTVTLLAEAFPFQPFVAIGLQAAELPALRVVRAGSLSETEIHRLYTGAKFVLFPSFYEGFGFPIVTALSYGKTLVARRSELVQEIVARCPPARGRIVTFSQRDDLFRIVGRLLHGDEVPGEPLGTALTGPPRSWKDVARDILAFMERIVQPSGSARWFDRERMASQLLAFRTES